MKSIPYDIDFVDDIENDIKQHGTPDWVKKYIPVMRQILSMMNAIANYMSDDDVYKTVKRLIDGKQSILFVRKGNRDFVVSFEPGVKPEIEKSLRAIYISAMTDRIQSIYDDISSAPDISVSHEPLPPRPQPPSIKSRIKSAFNRARQIGISAMNSITEKEQKSHEYRYDISKAKSIFTVAMKAVQKAAQIVSDAVSVVKKAISKSRIRGPGL